MRPEVLPRAERAESRVAFSGRGGHEGSTRPILDLELEVLAPDIA
jgi:hypothetical protein